MSYRILILEDDLRLQATLSRHLRRQGHEIRGCETVREAIEALDEEMPDLVLTDIALPDGHCYPFLDELDRIPTPLGVVLMTGESSMEHPITAVKRGVADFLLKPFSLEALDVALENADKRRRGSGLFAMPAEKERTPIAQWRERFAPEIVGNAKGLLRVFDIIERTADTDCSILVTGESGTGKELVARAVHRASTRADGPFVTVNCAALPENLLESELFGHARGAFTGATANRDGRFTAANKGTIFLDEIGEMPLALQSKLLRVLQEKEVTPVGESKARKVDVRVVAATNRDLDEMVEKGDFREDLLYRLEVIPIELPSLRERRPDIPELVNHFVEKFNTKRGRRVEGLTDEAMEVLVAYEWPGNVRQLQNAVERMVVLKARGRLELEDLPRRIRRSAPDIPAKVGPVLPDDGLDLRDAVERFENGLILQALERTGWNKNQAAGMLRMNRTTLVEKLKKKKLKKPEAVAS